MPDIGRIVRHPSFTNHPRCGNVLNFHSSFAPTHLSAGSAWPSKRSSKPSAFSAAVSVFAPSGTGIIFGAKLNVSITPR